MRMGGKPAPFGIDEETLDEVIGQIALDPCLEFRGIHLFTGTQILDHKVFDSAISQRPSDRFEGGPETAATPAHG